MSAMTENETKAVMVFEDKDYKSSALHSLNLLRQNRQFCDVVLQIGKSEVFAHRAVLACASPYFFDLFTTHDDGSHEFRCKLNGGFERESFEKLVDYAYTARLEITKDQVKLIYMTANRLKMRPVVYQCGLFLVDLLNPDNCIGIRSIPGVSCDVDLIAKVDAFIQKEMADVVKSKELLQLPGIQVEILQKHRKKMEALNERHLCELVVDWIKQHVEDDVPTLDLLTEKVHMLYIENDNSLRDCNEIQNGDINDSEIIQDYKRMSKKMQTPNNKQRKKGNSVPAPSKPRQLLYSRPTSDTPSTTPEPDEHDWKLVSFCTTGEYSVMAIATLGGRLARVSIMLRLNASEEPHNVKDNVKDEAVVKPPDESYRLLPPMSSGRCAVGTADFNGRLLVCGGYDRGECLKSVQLYDPTTNAWTTLQQMLHSRGRFGLTVVDEKAFAVGGSDGHRELASVEYFDLASFKWNRVEPLPMARSNAGKFGVRKCELARKHKTKKRKKERKKKKKNLFLFNFSFIFKTRFVKKIKNVFFYFFIIFFKVFLLFFEIGNDF